VVYRQRADSRGPGASRWAVVALAVTAAAANLYQSTAWAARGQAAQAGGDYALAAADYASAHRGIVYDPDYIDAEGIDWYVLAAAGGTKAQAQRYSDMALRLARQAQVLDPHDAQHYQLEGRVLQLRGDLAGAQAAFRTALRLDPYNHPEYALDLAGAQEAAGDTAGAVRTAQAMLVLYPQAVVDNRHLDTTIKPTLANLEALVGNADLQSGDVAGAKVAARQAQHWYPDSLRGQALELELKKRLAQQ
jgi:tetratricopeptide (TPR) repeat protein